MENQNLDQRTDSDLLVSTESVQSTGQNLTAPTRPNNRTKEVIKYILLAICGLGLVTFLLIQLLWKGMDYYFTVYGGKDWGNITISVDAANNASGIQTDQRYNLVLTTKDTFDTSYSMKPTPHFKNEVKNNETYITLKNVTPAKETFDEFKKEIFTTTIDVGKINEPKTVHLIKGDQETVILLIRNNSNVTITETKKSEFVSVKTKIPVLNTK